MGNRSTPLRWWWAHDTQNGNGAPASAQRPANRCQPPMPHLPPTLTGEPFAQALPHRVSLPRAPNESLWPVYEYARHFRCGKPRRDYGLVFCLGARYVHCRAAARIYLCAWRYVAPEVALPAAATGQAGWSMQSWGNSQERKMPFQRKFRYVVLQEHIKIAYIFTPHRRLSHPACGSIPRFLCR